MAMMISKFHRIIQSKIVWAAFAILISVAFVGVYTGSKTGNRRQRMQRLDETVGRLYGKEISRREFSQAYRNVYIIYSLIMNRLIDVDEETGSALRQAAWRRLVILKKAAMMGLTEATPKQIIDEIQRQAAFRNKQSGEFDKNYYNSFVTHVLPTVGMNAKDLETLYAENLMIEKASSMAAQSTLVTEHEIRNTFHLYTDKLTVQYAIVPRDLADETDVTEEDAKRYFDEHPAEFQMPEKVIVEYVGFDIADYTNSVSVPDEMVATYYENNKQRYLKPTEQGASADAIQEYRPIEEVREEIIAELITELAREQAFNEADAFVAKLADEGATFQQVTEKEGLEIVSNTPAFALNEHVKGIAAGASFSRAAFNLEKDSTHYYSDPVVGYDSIYVIALVKKLPSFQLSFEAARTEATESARIVAADKAYTEKAESIHDAIAAALKTGTAFTDAASDHGLETNTTEPFDATTTLENEYGRDIVAETVMLEAGSLAELVSTRDGYLISYVISKELGDEAVTLPAMRNVLTSNIRDQKVREFAASWKNSLLDEANFEDLTVVDKPPSEES